MSVEDTEHVTGSQGLRVEVGVRRGSLVHLRKSWSVHDFAFHFFKEENALLAFALQK